MKPKDHIYTMLQQATDWVSGEEIRSQLGISRVAVWKHIKGMGNAGITIESSPRGYRLIEDPDSLLPYDFPERQNHIHCHAELPSTMDTAIGLAREGCPANTVVVADIQGKGRGRLQRQWSSGKGGLYFTVIIRPDIPIMHASLFNLAAAVDMTQVLRDRLGLQASVKWPNDILVEGKKLCGILSQMESEGGSISSMAIGIGLNVNNAPPADVPNATSIATILGRRVARTEILAAFLDRFEERVEDFDASRLIDQWRQINCTIGKKVSIATVNDTFTGTAVGIDAHGGLILERADGSRHTVVHGDCFHQ